MGNNDTNMGLWKPEQVILLTGNELVVTLVVPGAVF